MQIHMQVPVKVLIWREKWVRESDVESHLEQCKH